MGNSENQDNYYTAGNQELATESRLTVERLEPVRPTERISRRCRHHLTFVLFGSDVG